MSEKLNISLFNIFFLQFNKILKEGWGTTLNVQDLLELPENLYSNYNKSKFQSIASNLINNKNKKNYFIFHVIFERHKYNILFIGFLKLITIILSFSGSILIGMMVDYIEQDDKSFYDGLILVSYFIFAFGFSAIMNTIFEVRVNYLQTRIKGALITSIFDKLSLLNVQDCVENKITSSFAMNLIQVDVDRVAE